MRELNREDLMNILLGCTILGTGGGGSLEEGIRSIDEALAAGKKFRLVTFDEMDPEAVIGTPYACEKCRSEMPQQRDLGGGHMVSCLRADELKELQ